MDACGSAKKRKRLPNEDQHQEQSVHSVGEPSQPLHGTTNIRGHINRQGKGSLCELFEAGTNECFIIDEQSQTTPEVSARPKPITTVDWRAELCRVLEVVPHTSNDDILDRLEDAFNELKEARRLQQTLPDQIQASPRFQVLYRVSCAEAATRLYEKPPWIVDSGPQNAHLRGSNPISNLELYLERKKDIAFIVYTDFECCQRISTRGHMRHHDHYHPVDEDVLPFIQQELIVLVSDKMKSATSMLATLALEGIPNPISTPEIGRISYPYLWWFHRRIEIDEAISGFDEETRSSIIVLRNFIHDRMQNEWKTVKQLISRGLITADFLDYLFIPGEILVSKLHGEGLANIEGHEVAGWLLTSVKSKTVKRQIEVSSWSYDSTFKQLREFLELPQDYLSPPRSDPEFDIEDLAFYPVKFASEETNEAILKRGKMFWKCRKQNYVFHRKLAGDGTHGSIDARFMIDRETYNHMHEKANEKAFQELGNIINTLEQELMNEDQPNLPDSFYMCLPTRIFGFNMQKKEWVNLEVYHLADVEWNTKAFEYLVINPVTKELIQAVVMNQLGGQANTDLIRGKGNGLFLLLHGGPGTGKTMTAESVAEIARKPLYRVSCGDIGTKADTVEDYLNVVLHLGNTWGCVVLLDEADVFLEQRSLQNLERNALVSVFLRVLEYYDGILILTSNRVGTFDEAFKSRIQLSLHYNNLGQQERLKIWKNFLQHLEDFQKSVKEESTCQSQIEARIGHGFDIPSLEKRLTELSKENLNGREIRNALSTARQLAMFRNEPLAYKHLRDVMEETKKFDAYLKEVNRGASEDEKMRSQVIR